MASFSGGHEPPEPEPPDSNMNIDSCYDPPSPATFVTVDSAQSDFDSDNSSSTLVSYHDFEIKGTKGKRPRRKSIDSSIPLGQQYIEQQSSVDCSFPLGQQTQVEQTPIPLSDSIDISQISCSQNLETQTQQTVRLSSHAPAGRQAYSLNDKGPFSVHVQRIDKENLNLKTSLHPVHFGKFLYKNNLKNIVEGSIQRIGRNRVTIAFLTAADANCFIGNNVLVDNGYKAFIPSFSTTRMGLARGIPVDLTTEEILDSIVVPDGCGKVLKVRRLNYKVKLQEKYEWKASQSCVLTFDGQVLPTKIFLHYNSIPVEKYYYPTIQCFKCCRFGHTMKLCRSKPQCFKCSTVGHMGDSCSVDHDNATCICCSGNHFATDKRCPEHARQKSIKISMTDLHISYVEAAKLHSPIARGKSYSEVTKQIPFSPVSNLATPRNTSSSYKKTVFLNPRGPPLKRFGYDQTAHNNIVSTPSSPSSNGVAFRFGNKNEPSALDLILNLIRLLSESTNILPSNAAESLLSMFDTNSNYHGFSRNTVELPRVKKQKI